MKSFLISLGGDKAGEIVDILMHLGQPSEVNGTVNVEVSDISGNPIDANITLVRSSKEENGGILEVKDKFRTENGKLKVDLESNYTRIEVERAGYIPVYRDFNFEKVKDYLVQVTLGKGGGGFGSILTLMLTVSAPLVWAVMKFTGILSQSKYVFTAAVVLSMVEFVGALFGLLTIGRYLQNQPKLRKFGNLVRGVGITLGAYFAILPFIYLKLGRVLSDEDVLVIATLTVVLASIGMIIEDKILSSLHVNRKILKASFGAGIGTLIGGLISYYVLSRYTSVLNGLSVSKNILIFLPFLIALFSIVWGYLITTALKIESRDIAAGLTSLAGILVISTAAVMVLHAPQLLVPFVVPSVIGGLIGFLLVIKMPEGEVSDIKISLISRASKKYKYSVEAIAVDTSENRLNRLKYVENKIPVPLSSETCDEVVDFLKTKITKIFEKIMEECSRFFDNFIIFIDLRGGDLCRCVPDIVKMLKEEFEIPVYVFVITCDKRVNYRWLKDVAEISDAVFPIDYTLFEDNVVIEGLAENGTEVVEEGCVGETIRRLAPILEIGDRASPSGADVSHVTRTLKKDNTVINTGCELMESDILPASEYNLSTISYFRVNVDACHDVNFEAEFIKYLNFAIKNNLWKFNMDSINNEKTRAMMILRGKRAALKTHMAKSRFSRIFKGLVVNVSDLLDEDSPYLEIIILNSHISCELPNVDTGSCYEDVVVQPPGQSEQDSDTEPNPDQEESAESEYSPELKELLFLDDGEDRSSSRGFPPEKFAQIVREHYSKPLIRNLAVKIARKHPGATNWLQAKDIYEWVRDNISYVCDPAGREYIQYPEETLESKGGDCDDQAVLLASLLLAVGFRASLIFVPNHVYVAAYVPDAPEDVRTFARKEKKDGTNWYDWIGMDPTCTGCSFGQLPDDDYKVEYVVDIL